MINEDLNYSVYQQTNGSYKVTGTKTFQFLNPETNLLESKEFSDIVYIHALSDISYAIGNLKSSYKEFVEKFLRQ